jgi:hypothetical protein
MSIWQSALFSNDSWMRLMNGLRILLTCGGALLLIYEARSAALGHGVSERTKKRIAIAMSALSIGAYFYFFNPNVRYPAYWVDDKFTAQAWLFCILALMLLVGYSRMPGLPTTRLSSRRVPRPAAHGFPRARRST